MDSETPVESDTKWMKRNRICTVHMRYFMVWEVYVFEGDRTIGGSGGNDHCEKYIE